MLAPDADPDAAVPVPADTDGGVDVGTDVGTVAETTSFSSILRAPQPMLGQGTLRRYSRRNARMRGSEGGEDDVEEDGEVEAVVSASRMMFWDLGRVPKMSKYDCWKARAHFLYPTVAPARR